MFFWVFFKFRVGLRAACFHSDMTKYTVSPSLFLSSFSHTLPLPAPTASLILTLPVYLSLFVCLFVSTVQTLRPCKPPPSFTTCLFLSSHPNPARNLLPQPYPTSPVKRNTIFLCPRKKRFLSNFII